MITERIEQGHWTNILVFTGDRRDPWGAYRITCADFDLDQQSDKRIPPTANISMLSVTDADVDLVRRLAREYDYVADVADQLQNEKRAAYAERYATAD